MLLFYLVIYLFMYLFVDLKCAFQIVNSEKSFSVFAEDPDQKKKWISSFSQCLTKDAIGLNYASKHNKHKQAQK
jgi:hypothetical protein